MWPCVVTKNNIIYAVTVVKKKVFLALLQMYCKLAYIVISTHDDTCKITIDSTKTEITYGAA